jgi:hypothetical protein
MTNTREQLWKRMEGLHEELYHSGKNYTADIYNKLNTVAILNIQPKDKNEDKILNLASIMTMFMCENKEPLHFSKGGDGDRFTCSLIHRKNNEYIFTTKRDIPYMSPEEAICKKYEIYPTIENQAKLKTSIENRASQYKLRDSEKMKRCITFEDAAKFDDYLLNTLYYDWYHEDMELQKLRYLVGKKVSDLTPEQKSEVSNYITTTLRPVLLYKAPGDSKLLVNNLPEFKTASYKELCDILVANTGECSYCKCKLSLLTTGYSESKLTFDANISLYGHRKDNITLCCSLCNSKKTFKNKLDI